VDFGIAGLASNFSISKVDMGTLRYMPPEVLSGKVNEISYPIDVWALGIILFGMVKTLKQIH
jgi:serine/threonine protein kinase